VSIQRSYAEKKDGGTVQRDAEAAAKSDAPTELFGVPGLLVEGAPLRRRAHVADPLGGTAVDGAAQAVLSRRRGAGARLPESLSGPLGDHFGHDLSGVRVHADAEAGELASSLQATAFTHGSDVYFAPGAYRPSSQQGQRLIAHELGHVVAQRTGADRGSGGGLRVGLASDPAEAAADRAADGAMVALRRSAATVAEQQETANDVMPGSIRRDVPVHLRRSVQVPIRREDLQSAPGNTFEKGTGSYQGVQTKTDDVAQTKKGGSTGTRTETTAKAVTGAYHSGKKDSEVFNGKSKVTTEGEVESLAGAEAWAKKIRESSDAQLLQAVSVLARAGAFSKGSGSASYERGPFSAGASGSYDAMAGVATGAEASVTVDTSGLIPAVEAACAAWIRAGVGLDAQADVFAKLWKMEFVATGKVSLFAGFEASASGKAWANWKEVGVSGEVSAFAGARASVSGGATLKLGPAELMAMAEAAAQAGAWAKASGKIVISFTGVEIGGEAEAFAGATASASAKAAFSFRGKEILSAKGEVSVDAGAGGKVKGKFALKGGKIALDFGAKAVVGIGGGLDGALNVDLYALGEAIGTQIYEGITKYTVEITGDAGLIDREPIVDALKAAAVKKLGYDIYIPHFRGYAASKLDGGKNGIKRQRVQEILDEYRGAIGRNLLYAEADAGIVMAAQEAFGKMLKHITIVGGKIEEFHAVDGAGIAQVRVDHAQEQAAAALRTALLAKAEETRKGTGKKPGTHVPDNAAVNSALGKKYGDLVKAFGGDKGLADAKAAAVIEEVFKGFWRHVVVQGGKVSSAVVDLKAAASADAEAAETARLMERLKALSSLQSACSAYAAEKAAGGKNGIKKDNVAALIKKHAGPLLKAGSDEAQIAADVVITEMVIAGLGEAIDTFVFSNGEIRAFKAGDSAGIKQRFAADKEAGKRQAKYNEARRKFVEYAAKKTRQGENGIKQSEVQSIVKGVVSSVGPDHVDEADRELTIAAREAFGTLINHVQITGGAVILVVSQTRMTAAKDKHAADAARVGKNFGDDQGNERRYDIARKVRPVMESYLARLRGNPKLRPQLGEIQQLVDTAMESRKDELTFSDAQAELVLTINRVFDGVIVVAADDKGRLFKMSFNPGRLAEMRRQFPLRQALTRPLTRYAAETANGRPTRDGLQAAIDEAIAAAPGLDAAERDGVLMEEVMAAFGARRIKSVTIDGGTITILRLGQ
jgi:hypothetical protein